MRDVITSAAAPKAVGPYSQAVRANGFLFLSGQIPLDPATNALIPETDVQSQTERIFKNIEAVLRGAGSHMDKVVKTTVFLADMNDFNAMNEVYGRHFPAAPPARSTVEVRRLPRDVKIEVEVIALA
jgi:2-iminobutanoate/2-iminopropanoate deaminase